MQSTNYTRRYKGVYLPFKLVGERGRQIIDCYCNNYEQSIIIWHHEVEVDQEPTKKQCNQ